MQQERGDRGLAGPSQQEAQPARRDREEGADPGRQPRGSSVAPPLLRSRHLPLRLSPERGGERKDGKEVTEDRPKWKRQMRDQVLASPNFKNVVHMSKCLLHTGAGVAAGPLMITRATRGPRRPGPRLLCFTYTVAPVFPVRHAEGPELFQGHPGQWLQSSG